MVVRVERARRAGEEVWLVALVGDPLAFDLSAPHSPDLRRAHATPAADPPPGRALLALSPQPAHRSSSPPSSLSTATGNRSPSSSCTASSRAKHGTAASRRVHTARRAAATRSTRSPPPRPIRLASPSGSSPPRRLLLFASAEQPSFVCCISQGTAGKSSPSKDDGPTPCAVSRGGLPLSCSLRSLFRRLRFFTLVSLESFPLFVSHCSVGEALPSLLAQRGRLEYSKPRAP